MTNGASRRRILQGAAAWSAIAALADFALTAEAALGGETSEGTEPFAPDLVRKLAEELAGREFAKPHIEVPEPFNALTPEQYHDIRFRPEATIWRGDNLGYEVKLLPLGWLYDTPVDLWIVDGDKARKLKADGTVFSLGASLEKGPQEAPYGLSGFAIQGPINRAEVNDEYVIFQGASYFRSLGRGEQFGLSARGLAINTARAGGEEFPIFRAFWIERPAPGATEIVVRALLDSVSTTGAYRFKVRPGQITEMDVDVDLFPRRELVHVGFAPLTSMYLHGSANQRVDHDIRPSVHNSEGLAVWNGMGERLWRPLTNPKTLQTSAFVDKNPKGFGLSQRSRSFSTYEDLEARFDRRPTAWVEPTGGWGDGYIELIEIPVTEEIHDNIVAYWKPANPLAAGKGHHFEYRLSWGADVPVAWTGAKVMKTHVANSESGDTTLFVIDFDGPAVAELRELPAADLATSHGKVANLLVQRHPEIQGLRVRFELQNGGTEVIELRLGLRLAGQLISESWLFRWTKP